MVSERASLADGAKKAHFFARIFHVSWGLLGLLAWLAPVGILFMLLANLGPLLALLPPFWPAFLALIFWVWALWFLWTKRPKKIWPPYFSALRMVEQRLDLAGIAPLSEPIILGTKDPILGQVAAEKSVALAKFNCPIWPKVEQKAQVFLAALALLSLGLMAQIYFRPACPIWTGLNPDIVALSGQGPIFVRAEMIEPEWANGTEILVEKTGQQHQIEAETKLRIDVFGAPNWLFSAPVLHGPNGFSRRLTRQESGNYGGDFILHRGGQYRISFWGNRFGLKLKMNRPPAPSFTGPIVANPKNDGRLEVQFPYRSTIELQSATLIIGPIGALYPKGTIRPLNIYSGQDGQATDDKGNIVGRAANDFAQDILAGLSVDARLRVCNKAEICTNSAPFSLEIPQKRRRNGLALALSQIRLILLRADESWSDLAAGYKWGSSGGQGAFDRFFAVHQVAQNGEISEELAMALSQLADGFSGSFTLSRAKSLAPEIWAAIELADGEGMSPAQLALARALAELSDAIAAKDQRAIEQAMIKARQALAQRLDEIAQENAASGSGGLEVEGPAGQAMGASDLSAMLDKLQADAENGQTEDALSGASDLAELMAQMRAGGAGGGGSGPLSDIETEQGGGTGSGGSGEGAETSDGNGAGADMADAANGPDANELAGAQRQLMDETARAATGDGDGQQLAQRQRALADQTRHLDEPGQTSNQGSNQSPEATPEAAQEAARQMDQAARALENGDFAKARQAQARALNQLENMGQHGAPSDPLGRQQPNQQEGRQQAGQNQHSRGGNGAGRGEETRVPDAEASGLNRKERDLLRQRRANRATPKEDRDLIDRLLQFWGH